MKIKSLNLRHYRNISDLELQPCDQVNVIYGDNAQGKTNIIEAISLFSGAKSFRGAKEKELIEIGQDKAEITLQFDSLRGERMAKIELPPSGSAKKAYINGVELDSITELSQEFCCVVFSPAHLSLLKDGPEKRRKFLDTCICQISPKYTKLINDYNRILFQRNSLIKQMWAKRMSIKEMQQELEIWDISLAGCGCAIHQMRMKYINRLSKFAAEVYEGICSQKEIFSLRYVSTVFEDPNCFSADDPSSLYKQRDRYLEVLRESLEEDIRLGYTTCGVQRDDFEIMIDSLNARAFGSQGQQRSCVLALKFGECRILQDAFDENPVILLDDVMSELDRGRQSFILNRVKDMQVFITCCDLSDLGMLEQGKIFRIEKGVCIECKTINQTELCD